MIVREYRAEPLQIPRSGTSHDFVAKTMLLYLIRCSMGSQWSSFRHRGAQCWSVFRRLKDKVVKLRFGVVEVVDDVREMPIRAWLYLCAFYV